MSCSGSTSTSKALINRLSGMARNAPEAPRIVAQTIKDKKLRVAESPTVTPTTRG